MLGISVYNGILIRSNVTQTMFLECFIYLFISSLYATALGQHNDNFVCCPDDALTWEARKYLIVQEIIQNDPDVICLQVRSSFASISHSCISTNIIVFSAR